MPDLGFCDHMLREIELFIYSRQIRHIAGMTIDSPLIQVGESCCVYPQNQPGGPLRAEVIGTKGNKMVLMPFNECTCDPGSKIVSVNHCTMVPVGMQFIGRIVDGRGNPLDQKGEIRTRSFYSLENYHKEEMQCTPQSEPLSLGMGELDNFLHCKKGDRISLMSNSVENEDRLTGTIARQGESDVNVIVLTGGNTNDVKRFVQYDLKDKGLQKSVLIVADEDQPAFVRVRATFLAATISEYFRDHGMHAMLFIRSLTDFIKAQTDIGLSTGERLLPNGYPPSVFTKLLDLLDRAGSSKSGSVTGLYSVLTEHLDIEEPVFAVLKDYVQGQIVLSGAS